MRDQDLNDIQRLPLFSGMATEHFSQMLRAAYAQDFPAQLQLFRQDDRADFLHVLMEGTVALFAQSGGREATMAIIRPVSSFILAACMLDQPLLMSARTMSRSRIVLIPATDVRKAFRADPEFAVAANRQLAMGFRDMVGQAKSLKLRKSNERLVDYLLTELEVQGTAGRVLISAEKRILASFLGMTPESLSRAFKSLEAAGVRVSGSQVAIPDLQRLRALLDDA